MAKHSDSKEFIRASFKYARKEADAENIASHLFAIGVFIGTTAPGNGEEASQSPGETLRLMLETLDRKVVDKVMGQERGRRKRPGAQKIRFPNNVRKAAKEYEAKYGKYGKIPYLQDHFPAKDGKRVSASTIRRCLEPDR